jgi:flagellar assembly protein FliH
MMNARAFVFETEFTQTGDVVGSPASKFVSRAEAEAQAVRARAEAEARTRQTAEVQGHASVDRIVAHLAPVTQQLAVIAASLRQEAAELALAAAKKIAGDALDANGAKAAAEAVANAVLLLRDKPTLVVSVEPSSLAAVNARVEQLKQMGRMPEMVFAADVRSRPGDWRVEWAEGSAGYSTADVEAAVEAAVQDRMNDPVEPQLDLFSA